MCWLLQIATMCVVDVQLGQHGLPQGLVLGHLLCINYMSQFGPLLTANAVLGQLYADDAQDYLHCLAYNAIAVKACHWSNDPGHSGCRPINYDPIQRKLNTFWRLGTVAKLDLTATCCQLRIISSTLPSQLKCLESRNHTISRAYLYSSQHGLSRPQRLLLA